MGASKAGLWRRAALALIVGLSLAYPVSAKAFIEGLSIRLGGYRPMQDDTRSITGNGVPQIGLEYELPWFPKIAGGDYWTTTISVDGMYYEPSKGRVFRAIPVSLNFLHKFEEQNGNTPYAGFGLLATTYGGTGQPTVVRAGAGIILGLDIGQTNFFLEGRYDVYLGRGAAIRPEGLRAYIGYRF
jgi:hypothetical protein